MADVPPPKNIEEFIAQYYHGLLIAGVVLISVAALMYEFWYSVNSDGLVGLLDATLLFFGIMCIGEGIRGFRDGDEYRNRYFTMVDKRGVEVTIKKRQKRKW